MPVMVYVTPVELNGLAKKSFNTCPICWMPLYIGEGPEAEKWCKVQVAFKNKPSESTKNPVSTENNRSKHAFGLPFDECNCNGAHLLHRSSQGVFLVRWDNVWNSVGLANGALIEFEQNVFEPLKNSDFFEATCVENGIFKNIDDSLNLIKLVGGYKKFEPDQVRPLFDRLLALFAGCKDCNGKMTINEYIPKLFNLVYNTGMYSKKTGVVRDTAADERRRPRRKDEYSERFDEEGSVHYLLLSGMVKKADIQKDGGKFNISDLNRRKTWSFDFIVCWCQLQILLSLWKWASVPSEFGHHVDYIYLGTADLYMAFILFSIHRMCITRPGTKLIEFETFHFFYSSLLPQLIRKRIGGNTPHNLFMCACNASGIPISKEEWDNPFTKTTREDNRLEKVRKHMQKIRTCIYRFWDSHFKYISNMIYHELDSVNYPLIPHPPQDIDYSNYFTTQTSCELILSNFTRIQRTLTLQESVNQLTPKLYWLHFKYITLLSINKSCSECDTQFTRVSPHRQAQSTYRLLWRRWCSVFYTWAQSLGADQDDGAPMVHAQFDSPPTHLDSSHPTLLHSVDFATPDGGACNGSSTEVRELLRLVNKMRGWGRCKSDGNGD